MELPYGSAEAVTPHDSTQNISNQSAGSSALYVGTTGTLRVTMRNGAVVNFGAIVGLIPIAVTRVHSTGTSASNIVALYR